MRWCLLTVVLLCFSRNARAQPATPAQSAEATQALQEVQRRVEAGDHEAAVQYAERAARLLTRPSFGLSLLLMREYLVLHRPADSLRWSSACVEAANNLARVQRRPEAVRLCEAERVRAEAMVSYIVIEWPDAATYDGVVELNGEAIPRTAFGSALPTNPGMVRIEVRGDRIVSSLARELSERVRARLRIVVEH